MGWSSDLESGGTRFDSRLPQVTFWSGRGHFFVNFGMSWEVSGSGLGTFLDRFGKVLGKTSDRVEQTKFSKMSGSIFPESGRFRIAFLAYPRTTNIKNIKFQFYRIFRIFVYKGSAAWAEPY